MSNSYFIIFKCFNYPFNNLDYYQYILSVSQENFMSRRSPFIGKSPTMIGILSEYDPEILTTEKIREHFVLDIDNKNFFFLYKEKNNEIEDIISLHNFIKISAETAIKLQSVYNKKDKFKDDFYLYECIKNLMEILIKRSKKVTASDYNIHIIIEKPNFFNIFENENERECFDINNRLLKAFYIFIMQIFKKFIIYKRFKRDKDIDDDDSIPESRVPSFVINLKEEEEKNIKMEEKDQELKGKSQLAKKAEQVFRNKFMNSSKYNSFIINFCQHHEVIDVNKIPYTFFNEFISYFEYDISINLMEIDIIGIIEQFYGKIKLLDFEEISNKRQKEPKIEKPKIKNSPKKREMKKEKQIKNRKQKQIKIEYENELKCIDTFKEDINLQNVYLFSFDNFSEYYQEYLRVIN